MDPTAPTTDPSSLPPGEAAGGEEATVWSFMNVMLRQRYLVFGLPLLGGLLAGIVSLLAPREYTAAASFLPQEASSQTSGLSALASQFGFTLPRSAAGSSAEFYASLLRSREVVRQVVTTRYNVTGSRSFSGNLMQYFGLDTTLGEHAAAEAARRIDRKFTVRTDRTTSVVSLEVHTRYPGLSAQIVSRFLEMVNDFNLRRRQSQARAEREFVEERLMAAQAALTDAEDAVAEFYRRNRRFSDSPQLVAEEARLERQVNHRQQLYLSLAQSFEVAKIEEVRNTPVITVLEHPEGFVEARARRTVAKVLAAAFLAAFVGVAAAFTRELFLRARRNRSREYEEFAVLWHDLAKSARTYLRLR
jgi:uncharacterized protein involved in exopolysaccharide biosynthesis